MFSLTKINWPNIIVNVSPPPRLTSTRIFSYVLKADEHCWQTQSHFNKNSIFTRNFVSHFHWMWPYEWYHYECDFAWKTSYFRLNFINSCFKLRSLVYRICLSTVLFPLSPAPKRSTLNVTSLYLIWQAPLLFYLAAIFLWCVDVEFVLCQCFWKIEFNSKSYRQRVTTCLSALNKWNYSM